MSDTSAYSNEEDLLTGDIPLPEYLSPGRFVIDAAKEIDSKIGFIYVTPVDLSTDKNPPVPRPVRLLLQRINNFLATGRLLEAMAASGEDDRVNAYGMSLINEANEALCAIIEGKIVLEDTPMVPGAGGEERVTAPLLSNLDAESSVEAFYNRIANPNYSYINLGTPGGNEGLVRY